MRIIIETIPHESQRYPTCGDWWFNVDGDLEIRVSHMNNWKYEFLVAFHELAEVIMCKDRGISQESVDSFDIAFEKNRVKGNVDEPGNDLKSPYFKEHQMATHLEKIMAQELKVDWDLYDKTVNEL